MARIKTPAFVNVDFHSDNVVRNPDDFDSVYHNTPATAQSFAHRAFNTLTNAVDKFFGTIPVAATPISSASTSSFRAPKKKLTDLDYDRMLHD